MDPWTVMQNSIEVYIHLLIADLRDRLEHLPTRYPDTYGQTFAFWSQRSRTGQEENLDR